MVSIIIPCHNSAKHLSECLESILMQEYRDYEVILVNDCSTDNTLQLAKNYSLLDKRISVTHTSETEKTGASFARNKGFSLSKGKYIVYLDSDDIWLPGTLKKLVNLIEINNTAGWVIGNSLYFTDNRYNSNSYYSSSYDFREGLYDEYSLILSFISKFYQTPVPGATIIKREVIEKIGGWENLFKKNYTDQALYAKILCITKTFVTHDILLLYRQHEKSSTNTSIKNGELHKNEVKYFEWLIHYLTNFEFKEKEEIINYAKIMKCKEDYYSSSAKSKTSLIQGIKKIIMKLFRKIKTLLGIIKKQLLKVIPKNIYRHFLHQRVKPHSEIFGYDRGTEIARFYIDKFIDENKNIIHGNCLEFQEPTYLLKFSDPSKIKINVIHQDDSNPMANFVADLTLPNTVPSNYFDCIICTHVLHVVFEKSKFISELERILKPGGYLIIAVPGISMCDYAWNELWRFTELGVKLLLEQTFPKELVNVKGYGNSLVAAGEIRGLASEEFSLKELNYTDGRFSVEVCAIAQKKINNESPTS